MIVTEVKTLRIELTPEESIQLYKSFESLVNYSSINTMPKHQVLKNLWLELERQQQNETLSNQT